MNKSKEQIKILLIGGGGHCKSSIDVIENALSNYKIIGIIDQPENLKTKVLGYSIIGTDSDIESLKGSFDQVLITIGAISTFDKRIRFYKKLKQLNLTLASIQSEYSYISKHACIGEGTIVMNGAFINSAVEIGVNNIINSKSIIEHDTVIGNHCHISTGAVINGGVTIGDSCFVGSNAMIRNGVSISNNVVVGAGAVIVKDINEPGVYVGSGKKIK